MYCIASQGVVTPDGLVSVLRGTRLCLQPFPFPSRSCHACARQIVHMSGPYHGARGGKHKHVRARLLRYIVRRRATNTRATDSFNYKRSPVSWMSRLIKGPDNVRYHLYGTHWRSVQQYNQWAPLHLWFSM